MSVPTQALPLSQTTRQARTTTAWWLNRDAARNWLAFGLLLGAWNAADDAASHERPDALRGYEAVSVRAVQRAHPAP